jgi:lysozyme
MNISDQGINAIKHFEGFRNRPYQDIVGKWTVGYGHLVRPGDGVVIGDFITPVQATTFLKHDLLEAEEVVNNYVQVSLTQFQFDALVSFVYNLGGANFIKSHLLSNLNAGDITAAANEFLKWDMAGNRHEEALKERREAEQRMFINGTYPV